MDFKNYKLGDFGAISESNSDPGTTNDAIAAKDKGGLSYGAWQFSTAANTLQDYISHEGKKYIDSGELKNTDYNIIGGVFYKSWKALAQAKKSEFLESQRTYVIRAFLTPMLNYAHGKGLKHKVSLSIQEFILHAAVAGWNLCISVLNDCPPQSLKSTDDEVILKALQNTFSTITYKKFWTYKPEWQLAAKHMWETNEFPKQLALLQYEKQNKLI